MDSYVTETLMIAEKNIPEQQKNEETKSA